MKNVITFIKETTALASDFLLPGMPGSEKYKNQEELPDSDNSSSGDELLDDDFELGDGDLENLPV